MLCFLSLFLADFLAINLFNRPLIADLLKIASLSIFATGLINFATATFTGYERMELNSLMLIFQSIFRTSFIIILVVFGLGTTGATIGYTVSALIAGVIGMFLMRSIYIHLPNSSSGKRELKAYLITLLTYGLPLSFATIITTLLPQFYAFLLPIHYINDNIQIGNYGVAINFVVLITFFATPVTTMIFPAFSKIDPQKDKESLNCVFRYSIKYASLLVLPVTALVMCLSGPATATLFGTTYSSAPLYLSLFAIQYLYTAFGSLSIPGFLNGQGQTRFFLKMGLLTGIIGFPMGYFLIMYFGVLGLITTALTAPLPSLILSILFIRRTYGLTVDWASSFRILFSSLLAAAVTYFVVSELFFAGWIELLLGVCVFVVALVPLLLLSRSVTHGDIANLRFMVGGLGMLSGIFSKLLRLIERLMDFLRL